VSALAAQSWGDGGHVLEVWCEGLRWRYALYHVPTGEVLSAGYALKRWRAVEHGRAAARAHGLLQCVPPRRYPAQLTFDLDDDSESLWSQR
jgi:hypothetical protein